MTTEYELLLGRLIEEKKAKLETLRERGTQKEAQGVVSEIEYIELEMRRYSESLALFRTKPIPKVGRWGKPETDPHASNAH